MRRFVYVWLAFGLVLTPIGAADATQKTGPDQKPVLAKPDGAWHRASDGPVPVVAAAATAMRMALAPTPFVSPWINTSNRSPVMASRALEQIRRTIEWWFGEAAMSRVPGQEQRRTESKKGQKAKAGETA